MCVAKGGKRGCKHAFWVSLLLLGYPGTAPDCHYDNNGILSWAMPQKKFFSAKPYPPSLCKGLCRTIVAREILKANFCTQFAGYNQALCL
jgi:hypothetical protein